MSSSISCQTKYIGLQNHSIREIICSNGIIICSGLKDGISFLSTIDYFSEDIISVDYENDSNNSNNVPIIIREMYNENLLLLASENRCQLISPSPYKSIPSYTFLNPNKLKSIQSEVTIEIPAPDCFHLLKNLESIKGLSEDSLKQEGLSLEFIINLVNQIRNNSLFSSDNTDYRYKMNKSFQLSMIIISGRYDLLKNLTNFLIGGQVISDIQVLNVAYGIQEALKKLGSYINDNKGFHSKSKFNGMNIEYNRLLTFENWTEEHNQYSTPRVLSNYGFYYKPSSYNSNDIGSGSGNCAHYCIEGQFGCWKVQPHPWQLLMHISSSSSFINGRIHNVPLIYSLPYIKQIEFEENIIENVTLPSNNNLVSVLTKTGYIIIYSSKTELKCVCVIDWVNGKLSSKDHIYTNVIKDNKLLYNFTIPKHEKNSENDNSESRWIEWATIDVCVTVIKGPYMGAKGYIKSMTNEKKIGVFLNGLDEEVFFSLNEIVPEKPKLKSNVIMTNGPHKGSKGKLMMIVNGVDGVVKIGPSSKIKAPLNTIATLRISPKENEKSDDLGPLRDYHLVNIISSPNSQDILLYDISSKGEIIQKEILSFTNKIIAARYFNVLNLLFIIFENEEKSYTIKLFTINESIVEKSSIDLDNIEGSICDINYLIKDSNPYIGILTSIGSFVVVDVSNSNIMKNINLPTTCTYHSFTFTNSVNHLILGTSDGLIKYDYIKTDDTQEGDDISKEKSLVLPDLDSISLETLKSFNKFSLEPLQVESYPPYGIKHYYPLVIGRDNTISKWHIPTSLNYEIDSYLIFELELPKPRRIDTMDIELKMNRGITSFDLENNPYRYYLTAEYQSLKTNKWKTIFNKFDLNSIIKNVESQDARIRNGSINLPNVTAKNLLLKLKYEVSKDLFTKQKRKIHTRKFTYIHDFDENGILYWFGTNEGKEDYKNPLETGKVDLELSHSKLFSPEMKKKDIIDRKANQSTYWGGTYPQWFRLDLGPEHKLLVDYYTLRHGYQYANSFLQNWCLQGSNDDEDWITLHEGDATPFTCGFDVKSFPVKDGIEHFRYFRVLQKGNYSMGPGKTGGSAYICIAGFELYGELISGSSSNVSPNYIVDFGVRLCGLKPNPGLTLKQTRMRRKAIAESKELHEKLFDKCCDPNTSLEFRHACLDLLTDIWKWQVLKMPLIDQKKVYDFIYWNIIKADKQTSIKAGKLALYGTSPPHMKQLLFNNMDKFLRVSAQEIQSKSGLKQLLTLIASSWNVNPKLSSRKCLEFLSEIGHELFESRTAFYNILRTHYGLYGYPLELDIFGATSNISHELKDKSKQSSGASKGSLSAENYKRRSEIKSKTLENRKVLEKKLIDLSHDFAIKRRALTTLLEQISISGESYAKYATEVTRAYDACIASQFAYHRVKKKLKNMNINEWEHSNDDVKLSRLTLIAEKVASLLNQHSQGEVEMSEEMMSKLFLYFCVFGTPSLRKEITRLLMNHITTHIPFPSLMLKKYFSRNTDFSRPVNLFPLQDVFESLQEIMSQDHVRFFYVDDLFRLLEDATDQVEPSMIDVPLVSWILLLLSNIMAREKNESPVHKGSKCRNCNMSPITGVRYRCVNCLDYDLCEQCADEECHNKRHVFLKIPTSLPLPPSIRGLSPPKDPLLPLFYPNNSSVDNLPTTINNPDIHNVLCDGCGKKNIKGIRYKCVHCDEFNLCEQCEGKVEHYHLHLFLKIKRPIPNTNTDQNPKALIPVLLHIGFYPSSQYKNAPYLDRSSKLSRSVTDATKLKMEQEINLSLSKSSLRASFADITELISSSDDESSDTDSDSDSDSDSDDSFELSFVSHPQATKAMFDGRHLGSIFNIMLLNAKIQNLGPELFLLSIRVIEGLISQYTPEDIWEDIIKNPQFESFLELVSSYPSSFIRSAVLQMMDKLVNPQSYILGREGEYTLQLIRASIRTKIILLVKEIELFSNFLLELLLVVTPDSVDDNEQENNYPNNHPTEIQEVSNKKKRQRRSSILNSYSSEEEYPLDAITSFLLNYLYEEEPIVSSSAARTWCIAFRALKYADPRKLQKLDILLDVVREALTASEELQVLISDDFVHLFKILFSLPNSASFQMNIFSQIVEIFSDVFSEGNTLIFTYLLSILGNNLDPKFKLTFESLSTLLKELSELLPDTLPTYVKDEKQNRLLKQVFDFLCTVFASNVTSQELLNQLVEFGEEKEDSDSYSYLFISWLSRLDPKPKSKSKIAKSPSSNKPVSLELPSATWKLGLMENEKKGLLDENKNLHTTVSDLGLSIVQLIKILSSDDERAKHFLDLCLTVLNEKPNSVVVAELCSTLIRNENLAYYFLIELDGFNFIAQQIKNFNPKLRSSFSAPAFATMLSVAQNKSFVHGSFNRPQVKRYTKNMENLASVSWLISPKNDKHLEKLLKETPSSNSVPWTHNFKSSKSHQEEKFTIEIEVPDNVILREIRMDCISNYNTTSRFPSHVMIETGTSLKRLLPVGRFNCKLEYKYHSNPNTRQTATFKFPLPEIEVVKFVRLHILPPKKSTWIAVSRIQLLGHSSLLYTKGDNEDPLLMDGLPLKTNLEILEHTIKYDKVKSTLAKKKSTQNFALSLLNVLSPKTSNSVQNIFVHLTKYDVSLSNKLLDQLLDGQSTCHAALIGKLCSLDDQETKKRLKRLSDLVFRELIHHTSYSLSSHLMPFLDALSEAISVNQKRNIYCEVTEEQIINLFNCAVNSIDGSLMQQSALLLLSSLIQSDANNFKTLLNRLKPYFNSEQDIFQSFTSSDKIIQKSFSLIGILSSSTTEASQLLKETNILDHIVKCMEKSSNQIFLESALMFLRNISYDRSIKTWLGENTFSLLFNMCSQNNLSSSLFYSIQEVLRSCINLHQKNQEKVASFLLNLVKSQDVSDFLFQLTVDMFSSEDKISVCLHPKNGSDEELNALVMPGAQFRQENIRFDPNSCHQNLDLDLDYLGITANGNALTGWRTAIAEKPISQGIRKWEVIIEKTSPTANIMIGVCEKNHKLNAYIGQINSGRGWSYYGATTGYSYHDGKSDSHYGQKMQQGDVIGVCLDMTQGTLSFSRNNEDLGIAFKSLQGKELYPAISLYDVGDRVRIQEVEASHIDNEPISYSRLEPNFPLQYQRNNPLFSFPAWMRLSDISNNVFPREKEKVISFLLDGQILNLNETLASIYQRCKSSNDMIDLSFEILSQDSSTTIPTESNSQEIEHSLDNLGSVFKYFAESNGIPLLVELLDTKMLQLVKAHDGELVETIITLNIPNELMNTIISLPIEASKNKINYGVWASWIRVLRQLLKIDGYTNTFIRNRECKSLLFYVMSLKTNIKSNGSIANITSNINQDISKIHTPSIHQIGPKFAGDTQSSPFISLLDSLYNFILEEQNENVEIRRQIYESGVLHFLLGTLILLYDSPPRNLSNKTFTDIEVKKKATMKLTKKNETPKTSGGDGKYWAKGTGYGTNLDDSTAASWSHEKYIKQQTEISNRMNIILKGLYVFLDFDPSLDDRMSNLDYYSIIADSNLLGVLESHLRNDSLLDMSLHSELYTYVLKVTRVIFKHRKLIDMLNLNDINANIYSLLSKLESTAKILLKKSHANKNKQDPFKEADKEIKLAHEIILTYNLSKDICKALTKESEKNVSEKSDVIEDEYIKALRPHQFGEYDMTYQNEYRHHYKSRIKSDNLSNSKKMKRLLSELGSLNNGLPLFKESSVFLRVDTERIDVMQCIITGPEDTPYANGCFQFDIYCPPDYPTSPPAINLQTTGHGTVRFNPNLYNCGKVCLSLLGTWRGGPNEKWNEHTTTLLQAFVSIQSLIFVKDPYFNEPGFESTMNTPKGEQQSKLYNENIRLATIKWAMIEQLKNPSPGFETAILTHFRLKKAAIIKDVEKWIEEAKTSSSQTHYQKLNEAYTELMKELQKLD